MPKIMMFLFTCLWATASFAADPENSPSAPSSNSYGSVPEQYTVPRISSTSMPLRKKELKSCREYLDICERSCVERGSLLKFQCIGKDFQPFQNHYLCQCADDLFNLTLKSN